MVDKNADRAVIAKTSYLEPASKKICECKKYPINYAEFAGKKGREYIGEERTHEK